jgi:hypothetical protein
LADAEAAKLTIGSPLGYADKFWQVGALSPPGTCLCCGREIDGTIRVLKGPYLNGPYRYVCSDCWKLPYLYFSDKKLADCGECWIPKGTYEHQHIRATAPRGARIGRAQEDARRALSAKARAAKPTRPRPKVGTRRAKLPRPR